MCGSCGRPRDSGKKSRECTKQSQSAYFRNDIKKKLSRECRARRASAKQEEDAERRSRRADHCEKKRASPQSGTHGRHKTMTTRTLLEKISRWRDSEGHGNIANRCNERLALRTGNCKESESCRKTAEKGEHHDSSGEGSGRRDSGKAAPGGRL